MSAPIQVPSPLTMQQAPARESAFSLAVAKQCQAQGKAVVDCSAWSGQSSFDSAAIALLLAGARSAAKAGGKLELLNVSANLLKLMSLYGAEELFSV